jgi:hypothetical protein
MKRSVYLFSILFILSCATPETEFRSFLDLSGTWEFSLDPDDNGIDELWFLKDFDDSVELPGTTDSNQKGYLNKDTTTAHLNRVYKYEGAAWYKKKITIPESFSGKHIELFLERTKSTRVWIDSTYISGSRILQSPQWFDITDHATPGEHTITLMVDNSLDLTPYRETHIFSDETQTNWNGVIGEMFIRAMPKTYISDLQVYPNIQDSTISIRMGIENGADLESGSFEFLVKRTDHEKTKWLPSVTIDTTISQKLEFSYELENHTKLWSEFEQPLYELTVLLKNDELTDSRTVSFGMREFAVEGTQFTINGHTTFLRGKHDAAVFPETGHTPTDVKSWLRVFRIAKSYGINHYRFHSYTPPKAAFTAADQTGIYLQPELPFWGGLDSTNIALMLRDEGYALLKEFGNHPSFVMFSHGNEIWSGHDNVEANLKALKEYDDRPLYAMGSNNNIGYVWPRDIADFHIAARTPSDGDTTLTHTRLTHPFVDSREGGILNTQFPSSDFEYGYSVDRLDIPLITHEIGQYQIYPDYKEIEKYTGPVKAWNLEVFKNRLEKSGMLDQNEDFQKASGAWSAICYKAEMETAIRTEGLAGFQLLDLQDFSGQGTALVGILDAFMDSKEVVTPEVWKQSCNDVVILLEFEKYVWTNNENFLANVKVANYSLNTLSNPLNWSVTDSEGNIINEGIIDDRSYSVGGLTSAGKVELELSDIKQAERLELHISLEGTSYSNSYPLWVYLEKTPSPEPKNILIENRLTPGVLSGLEEGNTVLLFPEKEDVDGNSVGGLFPPNFWNYEMFKGISESNGKPYSPGTLGLLMNPDHPIFNAFPTDFHTNWQWFSIVKHSNPMILDDTEANYRPVVQVIDNLQRNHKLGLIFEFNVGQGKLLICMSRLPELTENPEAVQLYRSILSYMNSPAFSPEHDIDPNMLIKLFDYN